MDLLRKTANIQPIHGVLRKIRAKCLYFVWEPKALGLSKTMSKALQLHKLPRNVNPIDVNHMFYGNFIGVQYVFEQSLDWEALSKSWVSICEAFPALAGRYDHGGSRIIKSGAPVCIEAHSERTYDGFSEIKDNASHRSKFIIEPSRKSILAGRQNLASLKLTHFADHGCVLGLAINHVITDAGGFHKIAHHLAKTYGAIIDGKPLPLATFITSIPEFSFGTTRNWNETKSELTRQSLKAPAKIQGLTGFLPHNLTLWTMNKITSQQRLHIHLSPDQVQQLKSTAHSESGEDWISTNASLCAHFTSVMIKLIHDGRPKKLIRLGQLLDLRSRYFDDADNQQNNFIGNAILIHTEQARLEAYDRGSLTRFFKSMVGDLSPEFVRSRLDVIADSLRHGRTYPGLEMSTPLIAVNNQTKMPVYNIDFAGITPQNVIPQDVGDNIIFFPASDGGVDVYIRDILNPKRQTRLDSAEWQDRIFDF